MVLDVPPVPVAVRGGRADAVEAVEFDGRLVRTLSAVDPSLGYELTRRFAEVMAERLQSARLRMADLSMAPAG